MGRPETWQEPAVAASYEARRFGTRLARWKHRRDEDLVGRLLRAAGARGPLLDAPCGTGRLFAALERAAPPVVGLDLSGPMLAQVGARSASPDLAGLVRGALGRLPFPDGTFGAAVCVRFLFHVPSAAGRVAFLAELARVTVPGQPLLVQVRYRGTGKHAGRYLRSRVGRAARYRPAPGRRELEGELGDAGLALERLVPVSRAFSDKALLVARARRS